MTNAVSGLVMMSIGEREGLLTAVAGAGSGSEAAGGAASALATGAGGGAGAVSAGAAAATATGGEGGAGGGGGGALAHAHRLPPSAYPISNGAFTRRMLLGTFLHPSGWSGQLRRIVKDDAERVALSAQNATDAMAHLDTVRAALARHRSMAHCKHHRVALPGRQHHRTRLHAWALLGEHQLPAF